MRPNEINILGRKHCPSIEARSSRTRRWSTDAARADYYRHSRSVRFARRSLKAA